MTIFEKLIWDEWNVAHIARHKVTRLEVEEVVSGEPVFSESHTGRIRVIGHTIQKRVLTVILARKGEGSFYTVTPRPASRKERKRYSEYKGCEQAA